MEIPKEKSKKSSAQNSEDSLADELPFWSAPFGIRLLNQIRYKRGLTALDIGFGTGFPLTELAMRLGKSSRVYGIDPWEGGHERTRKKLKQFSVVNTTLIRGVAENIPLKNNSTDLITSNNGLNNVNDLNKALAECSRILKPGGQFVQTLNLNTTMHEFYDILEDIMREKGMKAEIRKMYKHIYTKRKPLREIIKAIEKQRFTINEIIKDQFEYAFADGEAMLDHHFIKSAFVPSWQEILPVRKKENIFKAIRERMEINTKARGCFKLTIPFVLIDCEKSHNTSGKYTGKALH
ncbi:MAG: class I SAM-dependent methyltransferase [Bacteroidota bacterium]